MHGYSIFKKAGGELQLLRSSRRIQDLLSTTDLIRACSESIGTDRRRWTIRGRGKWKGLSCIFATANAFLDAVDTLFNVRIRGQFISFPIGLKGFVVIPFFFVDKA